MLHPRLSRLSAPILVVGLAIWFSSCALLEPTRDEAPEPEEEEESVIFADYEEFDVEQYVEEEPVMQTEIEHRVPAQLMEGQAGEGVERTVQGYRVQVYSTSSRSEADEYVSEVVTWWERQRQRGTLDEIYDGDVPEQPPVHLVYRQPYFRVRVGDFTSQEQARQLRDLLQRRFSGAFVAPSAVTVVR